MTMNQKLTGIFIALMLICTVRAGQSDETNFILNGKFQDPACIITQSNPFCILKNIGQEWFTYYYPQINTNDDCQFTLINARSMDPRSPSQNAVRLTNDNTDDGKQNEACIMQPLYFLPVGTYTLSFYAIIDQETPGTINQTLLVRFSVKNIFSPTFTDLKLIVARLDQRGQTYLQYSFTATQMTGPLFIVSFCDITSPSPNGIAIRNVKFLKENDNCPLSSYVIVPGMQAKANSQFYDTTAPYCGSDQAGTDLWDIVGETYVPVGCQDTISNNFEYVELIGASTRYFCMDQSQAYYDQNCLQYKAEGTGYACTKCQASYILRDIYDSSNMKETGCIYEDEQIPYCTKYQIHSNTYYCKSDGCSDGSQSILVSSTPSLYVCTKLQLFPFGVFGSCAVYDERLCACEQYTFLACDQCQDGNFVGPYCKQGQDICGDDPNQADFGIQVTVDQVGQVCATEGLISYCSVYKSIQGSQLSDCKQCQANSFLVDSADSRKICVTKLIPGCFLYKGNGLCQLINPQVIKSSIPVSLIPNCLADTKINRVLICLACKVGYILDSNRSDRCIKHVYYCSIYSKTLDGVCLLCVNNFFLLNNVCYRKSSNCLKQDFSGKCVQCLDRFTVKDGLCEVIPEITECKDGQYRNSKGICESGKVKNCKSFISPTGDCDNCNPGFEFNIRFECIANQIICPAKTATTKYFVQLAKCVPTDVHCEIPNQDGYCPVCQQDFYAQNGKCREVVGYQELLKEEYGKELRVDDFGQTYFVTKGNSIKYLNEEKGKQGGNLRGNSNVDLENILGRNENAIHSVEISKLIGMRFVQLDAAEAAKITTRFN